MGKVSICLVMAAAFVVGSLQSDLSVAAETGTITGRIVFDGDVPEPVLVVKKGAPIKDAAVCAAEDQYDNTLIVDPKTKGVKNVFAYIRSRDAKKLDIPAELKKSKEAEVVFDQKNCRFIPHTMIVRTDQKVIVKSDDDCAHNTHTTPIKNDAVNFAIAANNRKGIPVEMPLAESLPIPVVCDIHPGMKAYWFVTDNPYAVVSGEDGTFKIENIPAGEKITVRLWHERVGYIKPYIKVTLKAGETHDTGDIEVPAKKFEK